MTGYTMSIPRSEVLDLNISVDQAMQFCVSCGVLVPPSQKVTPELLREHLSRRLSEKFGPDAESAGGESEPGQSSNHPSERKTGARLAESPSSSPGQPLQTSESVQSPSDTPQTASEDDQHRSNES